MPGSISCINLMHIKHCLYISHMDICIPYMHILHYTISCIYCMNIIYYIAYMDIYYIYMIYAYYKP